MMAPLADARRLVAAFFAPGKPFGDAVPLGCREADNRLQQLLEEARQEHPVLAALSEPDGAAPAEVDIAAVYEAAQEARSDSARAACLNV